MADPSLRSLWLCGLPFAEEVRKNDWPSIAPAPPSSEQREAADALVDALE